MIRCFDLISNSKLLPGPSLIGVCNESIPGSRVWKVGGTVAHAREHVAHVCHVEVVDQPEAAMQVVRESAAPQPGDVAVAVILHVLAEVVPVAREVDTRAENRAVQAVAAVVFQVVSLMFQKNVSNSPSQSNNNYPIQQNINSSNPPIFYLSDSI